MLHYGFDALFSNNSSSFFDFSSYEKEKSITIPESYKEFLRRYKTGYDSLRKEYCFFQNMGMNIPLVYYHYEKDNRGFSLDDFFSIDMILQGELEPELGLLRIIPTLDQRGGGFYISVKKGENLGRIYFLLWGDSTPLYLSDDIFEFVRGIRPMFNFDTYLEAKHIYKNWGEDFWRIREEESIKPSV
jgi:hypothetical protein